jgi:hypothetical protein
VASIAKEYEGANYPTTRAEAEAFYANFCDGNARLARRVFPEHGMQLFAQDFSDYPETLVSRRAKISEWARIRIKFWKAISMAGKKIGLRSG